MADYGERKSRIKKGCRLLRDNSYCKAFPDCTYKDNCKIYKATNLSDFLDLADTS